MQFRAIGAENRTVFFRLMSDYYRDGDDRDTPQAELDAFIRQLYEMLQRGEACGRLLEQEGQLVGFVLWALDKETGAFSERPGYGTILEIGITDSQRLHGAGREAVRYAEEQLRTQAPKGFYVCAYGPARGFWEKCGYLTQIGIAGNGLPILEKSADAR